MATTYVPLYTTTLASATSSLTISSISSAYTDLVLVSSMMGDAGTIDTRLTFNGDSSTNYSATRMWGDGTSGSSNRSSNRAFIDMNYGGSVTTTSPTTSIIEIFNYANTTTYKTVLMRSADVGGIYQASNANVAMWRGSTGSAAQAITSITITGTNNFKAGSTFSLYGIEAATIPSGAKATGGQIFADSTYMYHAFGSSGIFMPTTTLTVDVLVVAGGGSSGGAAYSQTGGGGAGGLLGFTSQLLATNNNYTVTVGAGGAATASTNAVGSQGSNSQFAGLTAAIGGGGGGSNNGSGPTSGGSGGGSGGDGAAGGAGTSGQGFAGSQFNVSTYYGGGGGGASETPDNTSTTRGGNGSSAYSSWGLATGTGQNVSGTYWYAGGGAGSARGSAGGNGGGGAASSGRDGIPGTANTGGGGGGPTGGSGTTQRGGAGGSGIVIVRYPK